MSPAETAVVRIDADLRLDGRVALVTGGSTGIGLSCARYLAAAGARVCVVARDGTRLQAAVDELNVSGVVAIGCAGSVTDEALRGRSVEECLAAFGRLDVLVNNAGAPGPKAALVDITPEQMADLTTINLHVPLLYAQLVHRAWMRKHGGSIVNISSFAGLQPRPGYGWYGTTKAGLDFLTKILALELAPQVRVNGVAPGIVLTEMMLANTTEEYRAMAAQRPLQRLGEPKHIAQAVLWLASDASAFTTGQVLAVEGGGLLS